MAETHDTLIGQTFNRLTVLSYHHSDRWNAQHYLCRCICGNTVTPNIVLVKRGRTKSCGCLVPDAVAAACRLRIRHGHARVGKLTSEYRILSNIKQRCLNPANTSYKNYGGRGILVCERWLLFENFFADMGPRPSPKHSIDRINNDGPYCKENCQWATAKEQGRNSRHNTLITAFGRTQCISAWAEEAGLKLNCLLARLNRDRLPPEEAISKKLHANHWALRRVPSPQNDQTAGS